MMRSMDTKTVFPPRSPGNHWAYWKVTRIADLPAATSRRRNTVRFIATPEALEDFGPATCVHCHKPIELEEKSHGVSGDYRPKTRAMRMWHYTCGWTATLNDIILNDCTAKEILASGHVTL